MKANISSAEWMTNMECVFTLKGVFVWVFTFRGRIAYTQTYMMHTMCLKYNQACCNVVAFRFGLFFLEVKKFLIHGSRYFKDLAISIWLKRIRTAKLCYTYSIDENYLVFNNTSNLNDSVCYSLITKLLLWLLYIIHYCLIKSF